MVERVEDGGPAFPQLVPGIFGGSTTAVGGASLRDYFAAKALEGMATSAGFQGAPWEKLAKDAYDAADAMLAARPPSEPLNARTQGVEVGR